MNKLFINVFHEDDLSELEMEEILAGNTCGVYTLQGPGSIEGRASEW